MSPASSRRGARRGHLLGAREPFAALRRRQRRVQRAHPGAGAVDDGELRQRRHRGEAGVQRRSSGPSSSMSPRKATRRPRRDAAGAVGRPGGGEDLEGGGHRGGVGVVAFVDDGDRAVEAAGAEQHGPAHAAALGRPPAAERDRGDAEVAAERLDGGEDAEGVHREVPAGRAEAEEEAAAAGGGGGAGACLAELRPRRGGTRGDRCGRSAAGGRRRGGRRRAGSGRSRCRGSGSRRRRARGRRRSRPSRGRCRGGRGRRRGGRPRPSSTIATCGRASAASGAISPGAFMPISITAKSASAGRRASVSGTPQWLL